MVEWESISKSNLPSQILKYPTQSSNSIPTFNFQPRKQTFSFFSLAAIIHHGCHFQYHRRHCPLQHQCCCHAPRGPSTSRPDLSPQSRRPCSVDLYHRLRGKPYHTASLPCWMHPGPDHCLVGKFRDLIVSETVNKLMFQRIVSRLSSRLFREPLLYQLCPFRLFHEEVMLPIRVLEG